MKITAVPQAVTPQTPSPPLSTRVLTMKTNVTPLSFEPPPDEQKLTIPDASETSNAVAEETQPISRQFADLAKQRRSLQLKARELAEREKAISAASQGGDRVEIARIKSEPLKVLLEHGVTYDQLRDEILANPVNPEVADLKAQIAALKGDVDKRFTDRETQAEQQVLSEMKRDADRLVAEGADFELVRATKSVPDVMRLIERTYRESGEVLDVREACQLVEQELLQRQLKLLELDKIKSKFASEVQLQPQRNQPVMRTLTNKDTASVPMSAKARALAAFYGTLKK